MDSGFSGLEFGTSTVPWAGVDGWKNRELTVASLDCAGGGLMDTRLGPAECEEEAPKSGEELRAFCFLLNLSWSKADFCQM